MTPRSPVLIVRGDLASTTGYARATDLYLDAIEDQYDAVLGVDLYPRFGRRTSWTYPLVDDAAISELVDRGSLDIDVLTVATPDQYRPFPTRRNIGCFFWETDRLGQPTWIAMINRCVSEMWVPAAFMGAMLVEEGVRKPVFWKPCPLPIASSPEGDAQRSMVLQQAALGEESPRLTTLRALRDSTDLLFLSTNTFIPRKGLPILIHEWQSVLDVAPQAALILKAGTIDVTMSRAALQTAIENTIRECWQRSTEPRIYLALGQLNALDIEALTRAADAQLTTSYGEGFGLGVFETLIAGRPSICPRHTSLSELLPPDYPYFLDTDWCSYGLADPAEVYPISARWGVPREGAVVSVVQRLVEDRISGTVEDHVQQAVAHALDVGVKAGESWNV